MYFLTVLGYHGRAYVVFRIGTLSLLNGLVALTLCGASIRHATRSSHILCEEVVIHHYIGRRKVCMRLNVIRVHIHMQLS
jgi:hypothetical protein